MDLKVFPWPGEDGFHQKCYMSQDVLVTVGAKIRQYVLICTCQKLIICNIWSKVDIDLQSLSFSDTVYSTKNPLCDREHNVKRLKIIFPNKATEVKVNIIFKNAESVVLVKNDRSATRKLEMKVFQLLQCFCVGKGFVIDCQKSKYAQLIGISYILINDIDKAETANLSEYVLINSKTRMCIEEVHSLDWYKQMNNENPVSPIGGLDSVVSMLRDLIQLSVSPKQTFKRVGIQPPRGILLRGPPGCGKTSLVRYTAQSEKAYLLSVNGPEIFGSLPGETEDNLRQIFNSARQKCEEGFCILFIDEIESICPKGGKSGGLHESRATAQLLVLMDKLGEENFLIIAATNRPHALDPALRRPGRFDREVLIGPPDIEQRYEILKSHASCMLIGADVSLDTVAMVTNGYVGADLAAVCHEASYLAIAEGQQKGEKILSQVSQRHFLAAIRKVQPSLQKGAEGLVDVRPVHWEDIGGLEPVKLNIQQAVEWPIKHPEAFKRMGLQPPRGVLLYGPPGCCKTTLVRAAATACHSTFLSISGAQLYSPYVGDSERILAEVFQKARACAPSILFLDEMDSIIGKRSDTNNHGVQGRVLSMLLNEMDGVGVRLDDGAGSSQKQKVLEGAYSSAKNSSDVQSIDNKNVLIVAATNRPDLLDEALMRPGRIDRIVYVPHPDKKARRKILEIYTRKMTLNSCDLDDLASVTDMYTGADLESLCREAALCALTEDLTTSVVTMQHFRQALQAVGASLTPDIVQQYSNINFSRLKT